MNKNTLIFLSVDGLGLNQKWKGNCLKLADKPNINHLISGIYPWATLSNDSKTSKINTKKEYTTVSTDIDKNFYQMLHGDKDVLTLNDKIKSLVESKEFINLKIFDDLSIHSMNSNSKNVHVFFMLSNNGSHCDIDNFKYILNILIKKGLNPLLHLIADGKEDKQYSFDKHLKQLNSFLMKRNIQIATISGRNFAHIKYGRDFKNFDNVNEYFKTICGIGNNKFSNPIDYAKKSLFNKMKDQNIEPAFNSNINKYFLENNDSILFIDSDYDSYSSLLNLIRSEEKYKNVFIASTNPIYGNDVDSIMFPESGDFNKSITNIASANNLKSLVLSFSHKKGFINKFYGFDKNENVVKKVIKTEYTKNNLDYIFAANKCIIDSAIKAIGKYDLVVLHVPTIAEAAYEGDLKLLKFAIENFDKNLGRLINYSRVTGSVITFTSPYGVSEKMLNKNLEIITYKKNSIVPFVFTNGDLSSKRLKSNFVGLYSTILVTLGIKDLDELTLDRSLITSNYNKDMIKARLQDEYIVWKENLALPLIKDFEENSLSLYADMHKSPDYINKKQQYIIIKEIIKLHEKIFTTPMARKELFDCLYEYVKYNNIDFENFKYDYSKAVMTLFDKEVKLASKSRFASRFFDSYIWKTHIKRNDKWFTKLKSEIEPSIVRSMPESKIKKMVNYLDVNVEPYQFFQRLMNSERDVLATNDSFKVIDFYENIKDEVAEIYEKYFGSKVDNVDDEIKLVDDVRNNPDFDKIVAYYESFLEVLMFIDDHKDKATLYNQKYQENVDILGKNEIKDIFETNIYELNFIVRKIVNIYKGWKRNVSIINKEAYRAINKEINKYDNKYNRRYENAFNSIAYDGEFFENVDLENQEYFESLMNEKVKKIGFFDNPTIDVEEKEEELVLFSGFDDDGDDDIVVDEIEPSISVKSVDDKTLIWMKKRNEEKANIDNISSNISLEAENAVFDERKQRNSKDKILKYRNLSNVWFKKTSRKDSEV